MTGIDGVAAYLIGVAISLVFFSLYLWGLAVNGLLYPFLVALFFLPAVREGWMSRKAVFLDGMGSPAVVRFLLGAVGLLWLLEYLSAPLIWDAVLDHYRYAREISRQHQIPLQWVNHTGDMPKMTELVWAGFWSLGGEALSKMSSALATVLLLWLLLIFPVEGKGPTWMSWVIFLTGPFFLAIFSWGYVEGFLAFFEILALYCFWKSLEDQKTGIWTFLVAFFLGTALSIKYTAVLAILPIVLLALYELLVRKKALRMGWVCSIAFLVPCFPWLLKNFMAYGSPFYPLATDWFGSWVGYGPELEKGLWKDTGRPEDLDTLAILRTLWGNFFTQDNGVGAPWTPLALMGLPWIWKMNRNRLAWVLFFFVLLFMGGWALFCTGLRHAAGGALALALLGMLGWEAAWRTKDRWPRWIFSVGTLLSIWLCFCAQSDSTAPLASALGAEDPLKRLKRHYTFSADTYEGYRFIERDSDPWDKVVAFGVFQVYPLERTTFVDFKWKRPVFLQWASESGTADRLVLRMHREGVRFFLYQRQEASFFSRVSKDFQLEGMSTAEYERFWQSYMEEVKAYEEVRIFRPRQSPLSVPMKGSEMPYLREILSTRKK